MPRLNFTERQSYDRPKSRLDLAEEHGYDKADTKLLWAVNDIIDVTSKWLRNGDIDWRDRARYYLALSIISKDFSSMNNTNPLMELQTSEREKKCVREALGYVCSRED